MRAETLNVAAAVAILAGSIAGQTSAGTQQMTGGGEVSIRAEDGSLHVRVTGPRPGLASLCVGNAERVRILHASAAVGEARYERSKDNWNLTAGFDFRLRNERGRPPAEADRAAFLASMGWVANASDAGDVPREFTIRTGPDAEWLGVTFFTTSEPMAVSYWPATMDDDCRAAKIAQGYLPKTATFRPERWHRVNQR